MPSRKQENLKRALTQLTEFAATEKPSKVERAGIIQAFEFTFEQFWKVMKERAEQHGFEASSPRSAMKQAYKLGIITDEAAWLQMIKDRNLTTHVYNEGLAQEIYERILSLYVPAFQSAWANLVADRT
jgi:nucleotidyltransferase substrate binding protein (TIGR01987 family)